MGFALEMKMHGLNFFYVCLNLLPVIVPASSYALWKKGSPFVAWGLLAVVLIDFLTPLKSEGPWLWFCKLSFAGPGKISYHSAEFILDTKLEKSRNYLLLYSPHALWGYAIDIIFDAIHEHCGSTLVSAGADVVFKIPVLRRVMSWWGLTRVSSTALSRSLQWEHPRNIVALSPGGIAEMFYGLEEEQLVLARRKGFCRIALKTGASLLPMYVFGANDIFTRYWGPASAAAWLSKRISTSIVFWTGRFGIPYGFIPHASKLVVVIGHPIHVERVEEPTAADVDALHAKYIHALRGLFDNHKARMGESWKHKKLYLEDESIKRKTL